MTVLVPTMHKPNLLHGSGSDIPQDRASDISLGREITVKELKTKCSQAESTKLLDLRGCILSDKVFGELAVWCFLDPDRDIKEMCFSPECLTEKQLIKIHNVVDMLFQRSIILITE